MFTMNLFENFIAARERGEKCEIDKELFDYFLDILLPCFMNLTVLLCDGSKVIADYGFVEGEEVPTAFWKTPDGKFFAQKIKQIRYVVT